MSSFFDPQPVQWLSKVDTSDLAVVVIAIAPHKPGRVCWRSTYWFAQVAEADLQTFICKGTVVAVLGRRGLTLLVSSV